MVTEDWRKIERRKSCRNKSTGHPHSGCLAEWTASKFHPRKHSVTDGVLRLGYARKVTPEKRVRFLDWKEQTHLA
jgi:hypothetical protein